MSPDEITMRIARLTEYQNAAEHKIEGSKPHGPPMKTVVRPRIPMMKTGRLRILSGIRHRARRPKSQLLRVSDPFGHVVMRDIPAAHHYPDNGISGQPGCGGNDCRYKRPGCKFNP